MRPVPTGRVKWYDAEKGFGFLSQEDGEDVYVRSSALPDGVEGLKAGQKVEFGMAAGRRGPQALSLKIIDSPPSLTRTRREASAAEPGLRRRGPRSTSCHRHFNEELGAMGAFLMDEPGASFRPRGVDRLLTGQEPVC